MNELLDQLHDIEGLDPISSWPLAIGWWFVIGIIFLLIAIFIKKALFWMSWKYEALKSLKTLEKNLKEENSQQTLASLSLLLRKMALKRFSRDECAALSQENWLKWLKEKDPKGFDWPNQGQLLLKAPYAPKSTLYDLNQIKVLILASKRWVR